MGDHQSIWQRYSWKCFKWFARRMPNRVLKACVYTAWDRVSGEDWNDFMTCGELYTGLSD